MLILLTIINLKKCNVSWKRFPTHVILRMGIIKLCIKLNSFMSNTEVEKGTRKEPTATTFGMKPHVGCRLGRG